MRGDVILATYIILIKEDETEEYVIYKFGPIDCSLGKIKIHKGSGETLEI